MQFDNPSGRGIGRIGGGGKQILFGSDVPLLPFSQHAGVGRNQVYSCSKLVSRAITHSLFRSYQGKFTGRFVYLVTLTI